jgi:hypothetical protein
MDLVLKAVAPRKVKTGWLSSSVVLLEDIAAALVETTRGTPLEGMTVTTPMRLGQRDCLSVTLHRPSGSVVLFAENDKVVFGATTSLGGPGYHAFLISALDSSRAKLGLEWQVPAGQDSTGFAQHRAFGRLQAAMLEHFKATCAAVINKPADGPRSTSLPKDSRVETSDGEVITQLGIRPVDQFRHWATLEGEALQQAAAEFYPWWGRDFDGGFYRGLALHALWMEIRWAKPMEAGEQPYFRKVLLWLNEAMQRGALPPVSISIVSELMELASPNAPEFPRKEGIGYLRRRSLWTIGSDWIVLIPGSLHMKQLHDGTNMFWNDVFQARISEGVVSADSAPTKRPLTIGEIEMDRGFSAAEDGKGFLFQAVARTPSPNGPDRLCLMKVRMSSEAWRGEAEAIADSIALVKTGRV